jgi:hypothetical protein
MQLDAERGARHRARQHLALGADVEEPGAERQRDRHAGGDERDRIDDRVGDLKSGILALGACEAEAAAQETTIGVERVGSRGDQQERAHDERE